MSENQRDISGLADRVFDVVIVGGGISGAWLALHCVQSGYQTALIDRGDYAAETSSSSSKLLHGGIRYLQQMQFGKVRESAMERAHYIYAAPHLSKSIPFIVPTYRDFARSKLFLNCGMLAYRCLCLGENSLIDSAEEKLPPIRSISAAQLNKICGLESEPHTGGVVFYERHMVDSERMVWEILQTARSLGATTFNYVAATGLEKTEDAVSGVKVQDQMTGEEFTVRSRLVINATGPWIDFLNQGVQKNRATPNIDGFAVGSHIVTRQLFDHAIAITTKHQSDAKVDRGGRHVFIIPWRGYSLIGTSYNEIDNLEGELSIQTDHVQQLLDAVNEGLPSVNLSRNDLVSGYSGLYDLHTDNIQSTVYQGSGEYQIIDHEISDGVAGMVTALGAKYTTGRKLAALTVKLVADKLGTTANSERRKLHCTDYDSFNDFTRQKQQQYASKLSVEVIDHLLHHYGSGIDQLMARSVDNPAWLAPIMEGQPDILGQIVWAVEHEQAIQLKDVLFRRTSIGLMGIGRPQVEVVASLMADLLDWNERQVRTQINLAMEQIDGVECALIGR